MNTTEDKKLYLLQKLVENKKAQIKILQQVHDTNCWYDFSNGSSIDLHRPLISLQWTERDLLTSLNLLDMTEIINKLDLETEELDKVINNLTEDEISNLFDPQDEENKLVNILPVSPGTNEILAKYPVRILKKGTNWQVANITDECYEELEAAGQFPYFDYYFTINNFK